MLWRTQSSQGEEFEEYFGNIFMILYLSVLYETGILHLGIALEKPYTCDQGVSLIVMLLTEEVHGLSSVSSVT